MLDEELGKLAAKQAIERVSDPAEACFISPMFLVSKSDGSWRPARHQPKPTHYIELFKMESIQTAKGLLHKGDFMVKLYLKDAYLSVPLFPPTQKGCGLLLGKAALEVHNLTIWADQRPYVLTKLTKPIVAVLRKLGIRVILYLDGILILSTTWRE